MMKQNVASNSPYRLNEALAAYQHGEVDLAAAARHAGVSVHRIMTELQTRNITPPASAQKFQEGLQTLLATFGGSDALRQTVSNFTDQ